MLNIRRLEQVMTKTGKDKNKEHLKTQFYSELYLAKSPNPHSYQNPYNGNPMQIQQHNHVHVFTQQISAVWLHQIKRIPKMRKEQTMLCVEDRELYRRFSWEIRVRRLEDKTMTVIRDTTHLEMIGVGERLNARRVD